MTTQVMTTDERAIEEATVEAFKAGLRGELIRPRDEAYDEARQVWNGMLDKRPAFIARLPWCDDEPTAVRVELPRAALRLELLHLPHLRQRVVNSSGRAARGRELAVASGAGWMRARLTVVDRNGDLGVTGVHSYVTSTR
jgi:hypothetical protein